MNLTGGQKRELHDALLSAFPDSGSLQRLVYFRLDQNLAAIAGGEGLADVAFRLIEWAEARGRIEELIERACEENPGNEALRIFVRGLQASQALKAPPTTRFLDFQLRAWQPDGGHAQVLVHSSPAGSLRKPLTLPFDVGQGDALRRVADEQCPGAPGTRQRVTEMGRQLASLLLPPAVSNLLGRSLERLTSGEGLRLRLCLDESLVDLPWEFLYCPDVTGGGPLDGFLALDTRVSLVREAPVARPSLPPLRQAQRLVFAGALQADGTDPWGVKGEFQSLQRALEERLKGFLTLEYTPAAGDRIDQALGYPAAIFHYSGHTDCHAGRGYLVREVHRLIPPGLPRFEDVDPFFSDRLNGLLRRAGTRLAVFSACYSGRWPFVGPLLQAGLAAVIGVQGQVSVQAASLFSEKVYAALAVGLSLDEAVVWARRSVMDGGVSPGPESCEWGAFMVYLPAAEAVLLPRPEESQEVHRHREAIRSDWGLPGESHR